MVFESAYLPTYLLTYLPFTIKAPRAIYIYIYIIYTPNLGSSASVLGPEREQGRFNQAREGAAGEQGGARGSSEGARESNERAQGRA